MPFHPHPTAPDALAPEFVPSILQITPEQAQAFAAHVALVREHGDALGAIPAFRQKVIGMKSAVAPAVWVPAAAEAANTLTHTGLIGLMLAGGTAAYLNYRGLNTKMQASSERFSPDTLHTLGQYYELFSRPSSDPTVEKPIISLRWRGRVETDWNKSVYQEHDISALQDIQKMARLAQANGVHEFVVGYNIATEYIPPDALPRVTTRHFLEVKGIRPDPGNFMESNMIAPPQFWVDLKPEKRMLPAADEKAALVEILRSVQPNHLAVVVYDSYKDIPQEQNKQMLRAVGMALKREYSDGHAEPTSKKNDVADNQAITSTKNREYHDAWLAPDGKGLVWQSKGFEVSRAPMRDVLDVDEEEIARLLRNPHQNAKETAKVAIGLLAEVLRSKTPNLAIRKLLGIPEEEGPIRPISRYPSEAIVEELAPSYSGRWGKTDYVNVNPVRKQLAKKILAAAVCVGALLGIARTTFAAAEEAYQGEMQKARNELVRETGSMPSTDRIRERVADNSAIAGIWGTWKDLQFVLEGKGPDFNMHNNAGTGQLGLEAGAGQDRVRNIEDSGSPTADWTLETSGAVSTEGYWTVATSSTLEAAKDGIHWNRTSESPIQDKTAYSLPLAIAVSTDPFIQVRRELKSQDFIPASSLVRVPVRQGMSIKAANIDGKPVKIDIQRDGTQFLQVDSAKSGTLRYWLIEDASAPKPHAIRPLRVEGGQMTSERAEEIQRTWNTAIPGFSDMHPDEQLQQLHAYFEKHVTYSPAPFPESFDKDARDLVGYSASAIALKKAQCNLAFTLTALNYLDPHDPEVILNGAIGYYNFEGPAGGVLSSDEAHMYGVKPDSTIVDNTPPSTEAQRSGESDGVNDLLPYGVGLLGLTALGTGIVYRRRLQVPYRWTVRQVRNAYNRTEQRKAEKAWNELRLQDPRVLSAATKVTDVLRYYDPSAVHRGVQQALVDVLRQPVPPLSSLDKLAQPHVHSKHTSWLLRKYAEVAVDPVHQDAVGMISEVIRQSRRAAKYTPRR